MSNFSGPNVSLAIRTEFEEKQLQQKNDTKILPKVSMSSSCNFELHSVELLIS
jgi:hypothetical protein